jgi:hypothetical protein
VPIRTFAEQYGVFSPLDLDLLQSVYDEVTDGIAAVDDRAMVEIASALFHAHQSGVRDRQLLLSAARRALFRRIA